MGSFVKVGSQTAANEQQRGTFVEVSTGKEIERNQEPAHSSPVVSKTTSSPVKSGVSKKKSAKTTAQPVKKAEKTAVQTKAPKITAKKVIRVPVKKTDPSAYGYDPMVAQDLENRQKQTSALKPGAKPFSAGKLAGDLVMRGMNLFAGFFSSGLAMAEDAGGYAAGLLTGQPGVNLAEGGIFNTWDQAIKREGQAMEQSAAKNVAKGGKAAETVYKYGTQTVAAMPQAVLAMLTGGGSAVASSASLASTAAKALSPSLARTISQAVSGMAKNPQYWTSFAQVVGPGYQQALEDGADHAHAALYAVGNGLLNAAVEIGGGVQKLPGALKGGTQTWKAIVDSMLEEGQEEVVQGIIERALQNVAYDQKNPLASASNPRAVLNPRTALEEFKGGAVVGGILGGGQAAVQAGINSYAQNQVQKHLDMMQSIVKERAAEIQSIQKQAEQEAADWIESLNIPRPVDINAVNAQADQDASAIVRDMFSQKPVQPTSPESVMKIIQDIQREQQARPGSILLNGDQLTQINQEIAKQQAAPVDVDSLLKGRARLDYEQLSPDTQAAVDRAYEQGTAGMDAEGRIFRIHPEDHIDRRDAADIGRRRSLNAFQFDHPELHRFFAGAAQWLKSGMGQKGGQIESAPGVLSDGITPSAHDRYWRTSRMQPEPVVRLLDEFGLSYAEIDKALDAIIKDKGQENYAAAKKVELVLDEMLTNGWTDLDGRFLPGIPEYVDATSKIAGSLNAEQEPDLGIMGQEIERLYGKQDAAPLTPDGQNGTIQETPETEESAYERREQERKEAYPESREDFLRRRFQPLEGGFESGEAAFRFRRPRNISRSAFSARQALIELGVPSVIVDGHVEKNLNGYTITHTQFEGGTMGKRLVAVNNNMSVSPLETAAHEAFHFWAGTESRFFFEDIIRDQILYTSEAFKNYEKVIADGYFGAEIDLFDANSRNVFMEELFAHIAGHIHSCEYETMLRPMFRDYDAVKAAWNQLAEYGRSHPAEMPPSIQWGQETGRDLGILGREIERLYGKSDTTPSDGLGAADAGTVNTDYDRLQAQSSEFHPEGENPARPVDVPVKDFTGRNIPKAASTVTGAEILNNADVERLQQIIADGMISFDTIHDTDAQSAARQTVSEIGFEGALERYRQAARSNVATKNNVALGQLLMKMAAQSGNESALAEIFYLYTTNSTNIAQAMQAQRMLRKLSPESQLSALQRSVNQLNERYDVPETTRQASNGISAEDALAAYQAVSDAYRDVLSAYQNVVDTMHGAFEDAANTERHPNTPGWVEQLGRDLARNARNRAGLGGEKQGPSFYSTLLNDLTSLMNEHVPKRTGERTKRTAADKIADLFANRAEYARAWEQAKTELAERYKDNPEALDALDDFLNASMGYNGAGPDTTMMRAVAEAALSNDVKLKELVVRGKYDADALVEQLSNTLIQETNASGTDAGIIRDAVHRYIQNRGESSSRSASDYLRSDVRRVMRDIGVKMSDIIQSRPGTKAETLDRITSMLTGEYGVSEQAAAKIANDIAADFEQMVRERSRARLEQMFKDRPKQAQKTLADKFEELVNLGAFSGNEFSQQTVKKLFGVGTGVEVSPELIRKFMAQEDQNGRDAVMDEIVKDLASQLPSTFRAKYDCLRYLAMLGNPRTHIRNILGNTLFQIPVTAKNRVGAAVEAGYNFFSGGRLERTKSLTGVNPASQLAKECRADWSNVSDFLSGSKYSEGRITARDIESEIDPFQNSNPLFKGLGKLSDMNGQLLSVEDTAAKRWIYTQSLAGYLKANGIKSISEADPLLLNRARNYAAQEAMRNTFNDHNAFSDFVAKLSALPNSENKWARRAGYVTEGLLPFKRTPANILSRAVEYSPVGAAASIADLVNRGVRGQATVGSVATGIDRLAAGLTGTVLLAVGFLLNGYFSGGDDEDDKQRDFNSLTGHQSYALELENGTSVTLDWLAPEAIPFFMGVELAHAWQDGGLSWEDALNALKNMSGPMLEMSMLQGLNDVIEDASYAQYHGGNVPAAFIVSAATNYATQIFPTLFGQLERSTENRRMTTYADKNSPIAKDLQFFLGKTSQKIPGLDYHQIPYIDEWGREESSGDPISRTFNNILNPAYMSQVQIDNVEKELQRLKDTTGNSSVFPAKVDKSFKVGDEMKYLTADEYTAFAKTVGQTRRDLLDRLMKQPGYKRLSDEQKAQAVASVYEYATGKGKMEVSKWKTDDSSIVKGVLKSMLPVESYILYRLNSDRDKSGSVNGAESALTLLELNGLSNQQRGKAWDALNDIKEDKNPFIGALPEAGVQSKTAIDIYDRYRELNNARMKPKDKAAEFLSYVRGLGLTSEQLKAVKNTYTFFGSYPIEW